MVAVAGVSPRSALATKRKRSPERPRHDPMVAKDKIRSKRKGTFGVPDGNLDQARHMGDGEERGGGGGIRAQSCANDPIVQHYVFLRFVDGACERSTLPQSIAHVPAEF